MATFEEAIEDSLEYFNNDELAASVFLTKYALTNPQGSIEERTPTAMHRRLAKEFARAEAKYENGLSEEEIYSYFDKFKYIIPQGSPMAGMANPYQVTSLSNCFVIRAPYDSYGGILKTDQEQAQLMKRRGGVGFDISTIRPKGIVTANAAKTTDGIGIFMDRFSNTSREVAQGGRRGALMLTISVHHPEIRTFISIKRNRRRVTGANISIRLSDEFMEAVKNNKMVQLRWPIDEKKNPQVEAWVDASSIWQEIIEAAHECAEPGLLFWDTIKKNSPADAYESLGFGTVSTNPCVIGDTIIAVADGRNGVSIKKLAEQGSDVPVYCTDPETGQTQIRYGRNPRKTGLARKIWKLTLDDGSTFRATPDHEILTKNRGYVKLKELTTDESIIPFNAFESNGYRQIAQIGAKMVGGRFRNRRQYRLIAEFFGLEIEPKTHAIHHRNFNSRDDRFANLEGMLHEEHRKLHSTKMQGHNNPYHGMTDEWKHNFASHPGESNPKYSGHTNEELLKAGRVLFESYGKFTHKLWVEHAKTHGYPQYLGNFFRFGSFKNFVNQVTTNHKVVSIEFCGYEDVYNITVDEHHNYHCITNSEDTDFFVASGICVKNCGEIVLSSYDSCRLLVVNAVSFVKNPFTPEAEFDWELYGKIVQVAQRLMDDVVDLELEAIDRILGKIEADPEPYDVKKIEIDLWSKIRESAEKGRRTGLGLTAIGDAVAAMNVTYGSPASIELIGDIYKHLALNSYRSSVTLAEERGAFPIYDYELEKDHVFINRIMNLDPNLRRRWQKYGRRNIANTTTAPAGSVSVMTQTSSGIEPVFLLSYKRRRKINPGDKQETRIDFVDDLGDTWQEYTVYHHWFKRWMEITGKTDPAESPYHDATAMDVDWINKIKAQAAAQEWVCHSISNTTNVPEDTTVDTIKEIYMTGWESGCKGVTVYRDKCRSGVLVSNNGTSRRNKKFVENHAPKRPEQLPCDIYHMQVRGEKWNFFVGLYDDKPYEIFAGLAEHVHLPRSRKTGYIKKNGTYNLYAGEDDNQLIIYDLAKVFDNATESAFTRTTSLALRHCVPVQYLVEQLEKGADKENEMFSLSKGLMRVLKQYIKDGTRPTMKKCSECSSKELAYQEGCVTCQACGHSKCG